MAALHTYLNFKGNTEEVFNFYKSVFGGDFAGFQRFKNMPGAEHMTPDDQGKLMHVALPIGKNSILMGSDYMESSGKPFTPGNNFGISIAADTEAEADQLFNGLSAGGQVTMPLQKTFWGAYFGMLTDKFGIQWMINFDYPPAN